MIKLLYMQTEQKTILRGTIYILIIALTLFLNFVK